MIDIQALPIAIALTIWDAAPIFLSVGLALAVLATATLPRQAFHTVWRLREVLAVEGIIYAAIFQPKLVPVLTLVALVHGVLAMAGSNSNTDTPGSPGQAARHRVGELVGALLYGSLAAAIIKIAAPSLPEHLAAYGTLAVLTGTLVGSRSGAIAIPAVAIAVHAGGIFPATLCVIATLVRPALLRILRQPAHPAENAIQNSSD